MFYFAIAFVILFFFALNDSFCARPEANNHLLVTGQLALAVEVFAFIVSFAVDAALSAAPRIGRIRLLGLLIPAIVVGLGGAIMPFWIYQGYGHFRFEHTWADVSCFFTEGYGLAFSMLVVPLFALAACGRRL